MNSERYVLLNESKGIPNIIKMLTDVVYNKFMNYPEDQIIKDNNLYSILINKNEFKYPFFEKLFVFINIVDNEQSSYYKHTMSDWNDIDKIYKNIHANIYITKNNIDELKELISHELFHAYEDYKRKLNSDKGFKDIDQNNVSIETDELQKIKNKFGNNDKLNKLSYFVYYMLNIEKRANVSRLYFELKKNNLTKKDINSEIFKKLTFYIIYQNIKNESEGLINSLNDDELNLFGEYIQNSAINNLYSNDKIAFKKRLIQYFKTESENTLKKMRKIMIEYLEDEGLMETKKSDRSRMIEIMKHLDQKTNL
jgi:hypothetical protein